LLNNGQVLR